MTLPVAILAGGLATRLRPMTEKIPKSLVEVGGEPFIVRQLDYLRRQGVRDVVLCVGYLGEMIEAAIGNGSRFGLRVCYSMDGPVLLGTGGALRRAMPLLGDACFVLYGDSYLPVNFGLIESEFWGSDQPALMTVLYNRNRWDKSNVLFVDGKLVEYNKTAARPEFTYIDYGLTIVKREIIERYPADQAFDLATLYRALSLEKSLHGYEVFSRFYEIGSSNGLRETEEFFRTGRIT
jgi:N-acetyl-alpha-D-muramate 1-phosphate uridylyltransferase